MLWGWCFGGGGCELCDVWGVCRGGIFCGC
jgi:hypothetical protein